MSGVFAIAKRQLSTTVVRRSGNPFQKPGENQPAQDLWRKMSYFVAIPAVVIMSVNVFTHMANEEHHRPEFIPYDHLRIRTKRFPWGDGNKSLFHNPHTNALPNGYEDEH